MVKRQIDANGLFPRRRLRCVRQDSIVLAACACSVPSFVGIDGSSVIWQLQYRDTYRPSVAIDVVNG